MGDDEAVGVDVDGGGTYDNTGVWRAFLLMNQHGAVQRLCCCC